MDQRVSTYGAGIVKTYSFYKKDLPKLFID